MKRPTFSPFVIINLCLVFITLLTRPVFAANIDVFDDSRNFKILVISDVHLNNDFQYKMNLNPSWYNPLNDMDAATFQEILDSTQKNIASGQIAKPDYIILLGDLVGHFTRKKKDIFQAEKTVFQSLKTHFPNIPIFYVFGNNDSFKRDYGPFAYKNFETPYSVAKQSGWLDGFLSTGIMCNAKKSRKNILPCISDEDSRNGHYAAYIQPKLKMLAFNSIYFSKYRKSITQQNAEDELQWLEQQLHAAKVNQERVLLVTHIPFGNNILDHSSFWKTKEESEFLRIWQSYKDIIITILVAHTHYDELKVINGASQNIEGSMLYTPGLSTSHGNSASIRLYDFAKQSKQWEMFDYTTFNFSENSNNDINVSKVYQFRDYYCKNKLTDKLIDCLKNVTSEKIKKYYTAGNPNFGGIIFAPQDAFLEITND